jgi:hypothetical protein
MFQEAEILEERGDLQNGSYKKYFEVSAAMHKAEIKEYFTGKQQESFTGKQQEYKGKQNPGKL